MDGPLSKDLSTVPRFDDNSFRSLDFSKADYDVLTEKLSAIDWPILRSICSFEEFPILFTDTLFQVCQKHVPPKKIPSGRSKALNALRRKRNRLQARLNALLDRASCNEAHIKSVRNKLALIFYDIKEATNAYDNLMETKAVDKIKSNPKYFYSYAKKLSAVKSTLSMLYNKKGDVVSSPHGMANILQCQFTSSFSDPSAACKKDPDFSTPIITAPQVESEFELLDEQILEVIKDIKNDSAPGMDGISAVLIKSCATSLCVPIRII